MSKISLRWRITLLMGALMMTVCLLLTALSIQNMTINFVAPILQQSVTNGTLDTFGNDKNAILFDDKTDNLPDGTHFVPEIKLNVEDAQRSFSATSYLYMALVVFGGMLAAYYLAGRAMRPISKLNDEIGEVDVNNLSKRIIVPQTKDEIEKLSVSFNKLLARLEQDFEQEKRFSANAAHELKTPLATITTGAQVLTMNPSVTAEDYRENLDITLQCVKRLSSVVDGLLLLGGSSLDIPFATVNIMQILQEIEKEIAPLYIEKNITLSCNLQAITLKGNHVLLYRAFFNLVENAFKYTEKSGTVSITSCDNNKEIIICITNSGNCIAPEDLQHIFEPFYRADKSRSRKIAGAGLGLSIAKDIFKLHNAEISIYSETDSGTVAQVKFKR